MVMLAARPIDKLSGRRRRLTEAIG